MPPVPVFGGEFGVREAERLLWRAGFGPRPGDADVLAARGLRGAVLSLTRPGAEHLEGPAPSVDGGSLAPDDTWGHDHLWWLDRMIRSSRQLVERMTLNWHDWFATSRAGVDSGGLMRKQNELLRRNALGSFRTILTEITRDPAMLIWLDGSENSKWSPNENYAREMMELFTLGANRGYRERDVREQARALTGFRNDWSDGVGPHSFRYDRELHDSGRKKVFGRAGAYDWRDSVRLCLTHRKHPSFVAAKLWSYFIPGEPDAATAGALAELYVRGRYAVRPLVEALLMHPRFYEGPRMVKPPAVYIAGLLRATGQGIAKDWSWISYITGQMLFHPPNVAGWDESRWLDTATFRGRWVAANHALAATALDPDPDETVYDTAETPETAVAKALQFWGNPAVTPATRAALLRFAGEADALADARWKRRTYPIIRQNALRILVASSPDLQTC